MEAPDHTVYRIHFGGDYRPAARHILTWMNGMCIFAAHVVCFNIRVVDRGSKWGKTCRTRRHEIMHMYIYWVQKTIIYVQ